MCGQLLASENKQPPPKGNLCPIRTQNTQTSFHPIRERTPMRARDWRMLADIVQQLIFPPETASTNLRPDLVFWSTSLKTVYIIELTVPWENSMEEAYECEKLRYADLASETMQSGWNANVYPVEVGCRGFVASSTIRLLKDLGIHDKALRNTIRSVSEEVARSSWWIWLKRKDPYWAPNMSVWSSGTVLTQDTCWGPIILQWAALTTLNS